MAPLMPVNCARRDHASRARQGGRGQGIAETQMILSHKAAIELLVENAGVVGFNRYTLLNLHGVLFRDPRTASPPAATITPAAP